MSSFKGKRAHADKDIIDLRDKCKALRIKINESVNKISEFVSCNISIDYDDVNAPIYGEDIEEEIENGG